MKLERKAQSSAQTKLRTTLQGSEIETDCIKSLLAAVINATIQPFYVSCAAAETASMCVFSQSSRITDSMETLFYHYVMVFS